MFGRPLLSQSLLFSCSWVISLAKSLLFDLNFLKAHCFLNFFHAALRLYKFPAFPAKRFLNRLPLIRSNYFAFAANYPYQTNHLHGSTFVDYSSPLAVQLCCLFISIGCPTLSDHSSPSAVQLTLTIRPRRPSHLHWPFISVGHPALVDYLSPSAVQFSLAIHPRQPSNSLWPVISNDRPSSPTKFTTQCKALKYFIFAPYQFCLALIKYFSPTYFDLYGKSKISGWYPSPLIDVTIYKIFLGSLRFSFI